MDLPNNELNYNDVIRVVESWELIKCIPNYKERTGTMVLTKLFELEPATKAIFGLQNNNNNNDNNLLYGRHSMYFTQMIESIIHLLGPDFDLVKEMVNEVSIKHIRYGVKPEYFPCFVRSLVYTIEQLLIGSKVCTKQMKQSWRNVFKTICIDMVRVQYGSTNNNNTTKKKNNIWSSSSSSSSSSSIVSKKPSSSFSTISLFSLSSSSISSSCSSCPSSASTSSTSSCSGT